MPGMKKRFPTASAAPAAGTEVPTKVVTVNLVSDTQKVYKVDCGDIEVTEHEYLKFELGSNSPSGAKVVGVAITKEANAGPAASSVFAPAQPGKTAWYGTTNADGTLTVEDKHDMPANTPEVDYDYVLYVEYNNTQYNSDPKIRNETSGGGG